MAFGKRAYTSLLLDCCSQQEKNVFVIQYEPGTTSKIAACEQIGDFPFECNRSLSGHNHAPLAPPILLGLTRFTAGAFEFLTLIQSGDRPERERRKSWPSPERLSPHA